MCSQKKAATPDPGSPLFCFHRPLSAVFCRLSAVYREGHPHPPLKICSFPQANCCFWLCRTPTISVRLGSLGRFLLSLVFCLIAPKGVNFVSSPNLRQNAAVADTFADSKVVMGRCSAHPSPTPFAPSSPVCGLLDPRARRSYLFSAASIAAATSGESGVTLGSNRATALPWRSNRNLVKFHLMSPPNCGSADLSVR